MGLIHKIQEAKKSRNTATLRRNRICSRPWVFDTLWMAKFQMTNFSHEVHKTRFLAQENATFNFLSH